MHAPSTTVPSAASSSTTAGCGWRCSAVVGLQFVVVHWAPAQAVFDTVDLTLADWALATLIASSVLLFDEIRKLAERIVRSRLAAQLSA